MATTGLYVPRSASWRAEFESELLRFPAAKHDDRVDALGLIGNLLDDSRAPSKPKTADPETRRSGYHALIEAQKPPSVLLLSRRSLVPLSFQPLFALQSSFTQQAKGNGARHCPSRAGSSSA